MSTTSRRQDRLLQHLQADGEVGRTHREARYCPCCQLPASFWRQMPAGSFSRIFAALRLWTASIDVPFFFATSLKRFRRRTFSSAMAILSSSLAPGLQAQVAAAVSRVIAVRLGQKVAP